MKVRVTTASTNPARPFMVEVDGTDSGNWTPFGNEPTRESAERACDMMVEMYGAVKVSE